MNGAPKVVYDCNIFVQALINLDGPAGRCFAKAKAGEVSLVASAFVLSEIREIHEKVPLKYGITAAQTDELARNVISIATIMIDVPSVYRHPIDPDDSHYVDLAVASQAKLIVSRDRHLLALADATRQDGREFQSRFPDLKILDPITFLHELSAR